MTYAKARYAILALAASCLCLPPATLAETTLLAQQPPPTAPSGVVSPDQNLPPHIRKLTGFGERAEFSLDGRRVLFLTKTFGDAMEIDLATGVIRNLTAHFPHYGFTRALYLANGHILLSGPTEFNPSNVGAARTNCWMFVMDPESRARPWPLGVKAAEGPVPSRKRMHIAWSYRAAQFPDKMPAGSSQMHEADIVYENGVPKLANQRQILDSRDLPFKATMEPQNYRPPHERELIFSAYDYQQGEVFGVDLTTGKLTNYSNGPGVYDEPEGIFPSGEFTTVESDKHNPAGQGFDRADIHKLKLDGSGAMERLTFFADVPTYRSSNPVVSDDGRYMAFQMGRSGVAAGIGYGIFLYDFTKAPATPAQAPAAPVAPVAAQASSANGEGWVGRSAELALACVHKEYPNKIAHVLNDATDVKAPHDLTPAFFGCYDWHSSVHGHWLLARVARLHPQAPFAGRARAALDKSLTAEHIAGEVRYLKGAGRVSFERPYGLAWLLQLHGELREWAAEQPADRDVRRWADTLEPLTQAAVARVADWLPKLTAPIRIGEHSQTAFSFGLMLDWTRATGEKKLESLLVSRARDFYAKDRACPMAYEPSGEDFLSPCVAEADLMRRVLPQAEFASWLREFLPPIPADGRGDWLAPGVVTDPSDPKLGHLYGLNLSRAWMLRAIAGSLPPSDPRGAALTAAARTHHTAGMAGVTGEHYEGSHWLGTFAVYLETSRGLPVHATRP